jgi:hypothetical protein
MKIDIQINGNVIGGRQGWAYICNSMRFAVLKADLDKEQEYKDFQTFGNVKVIWNYRGEENGANGTLEISDGKWKIGGHGCMLKASFGFSDMMDGIENANIPTVRKDDIVAIATYSKQYEVAVLSLFKVGRIDIHCTTMASLTPLTDEEMQAVKADAVRWCNR